MNVKFYAEVKVCTCGGCSEDNDRLDPMRNMIISAAEEVGAKLDELNTYRTIESVTKGNLPEVPALIINDELVVSGYEPDYNELKKLFKKRK